jgi:tyrosine aminotransferase
VIPEFLNAPQSFFDETLKQLEQNAEASRQILSNIPGIEPIFPQGAMYLMLKLDLKLFDGIISDIQFVERLVEEESVLCLPGQCFRCPGDFVRIVFTAPKEKLELAFERIRDFCSRHSKKR